MTLRARFDDALTPPWTSLTPITVGPASVPATRVLVEESTGAPRLRIDVHASPGPRAFRQALVWRELAVVGFGQHVHFVPLQVGLHHSVGLDGYFGHLYPHATCIVVADASRLHAFDERGQLRWTSHVLGVDGVVVDRIEHEIIEGSGELDPPNGWMAFRLALASGAPIR